MNLDLLASILLGIIIVSTILGLTIFIIAFIRIRQAKRDINNRLREFHREYGYKPWH